MFWTPVARYAAFLKRNVNVHGRLHEDGNVNVNESAL